MVLNSQWSTCRPLLSAGIQGICHYCWLSHRNLKEILTLEKIRGGIGCRLRWVFICLGAFCLLLYQRRIRLFFFFSCNFISDSFDQGYPVYSNCSHIHSFSHSVYIGGVSGRGLCCGTCLEVRRPFWTVGSLPPPPYGTVPWTQTVRCGGLPSDPCG